MIKAVIFDWAGTTVDYGCFAPVGAFIKAFNDFGVMPTNAQVREPMGMLKHDHIRAMVNMAEINIAWKKIYGCEPTEKNIDEIYEKSEGYIMDSIAEHTEIKPYLLDTIAFLRKKGIKIGSTTGYTREMMDIVLKSAKAQGYEPDFYITPDMLDNMGRPYPYMIFENMRALGVKSVKEVIKVGDTTADILEGVNAGVTTIGVIDGSSVMGMNLEEFNSLSEAERAEKRSAVAEVFKKAGTDMVIKDLSELTAIINRLNE